MQTAYKAKLNSYLGDKKVRMFANNNTFIIKPKKDIKTVDKLKPDIIRMLLHYQSEKGWHLPENHLVTLTISLLGFLILLL